jgi:hypothetical protein
MRERMPAVLELQTSLVSELPRLAFGTFLPNGTGF